MDSVTKKSYQPPMVLSFYSDCNVIDQMIMPDGNEQLSSSNILELVNGGRVLMINSRKRNGLIVFKRYHAEFAGPGAVIGGNYDHDCEGVIAIGNLSLLSTESREERQKAYLIRRQWIRLIRQITENPSAHERVQKILDQFEQYFPRDIVSNIPDEAFSRLVGVLPQTVAIVRHIYFD